MVGMYLRHAVVLKRGFDPLSFCYTPISSLHPDRICGLEALRNRRKHLEVSTDGLIYELDPSGNFSIRVILSHVQWLDHRIA